MNQYKMITNILDLVKKLYSDEPDESGEYSSYDDIIYYDGNFYIVDSYGNKHYIEEKYIKIRSDDDIKKLKSITARLCFK